MKLDVGGGRAPAPGYTVLDIEARPGVDIVAPAWDTKLAACSVEEIRARHVFEHFSLAEAKLVLIEWQRILTDDGMVTVTVPDLNYHARQMFMPGQSEFCPQRTNFEHAIAGFYGWQERGEVMGHRYGYTPEMLYQLVKEAGFRVDIEPSRACDIVVIARKW